MTPGWALSLLLLPALAGAAAADLHVHLLMGESVPLFYRKAPSAEPAGVKDRRARFQNQVSLKDLEAADVRLVAAALYSPAVYGQLKGGHHQHLLKQISALETWAAKHPAVSIVRRPEELEAVLKSKEWRLGLLIAAEGAGGADTPARLDKLHERGLRMLTITHFKDTAWGGTADVSYWPKASCVPGGKDDGERNRLGLTENGAKLMEHAVAKGLMIDFTHSSDKTVLDAARLHPEMPILFSHEAYRDYTPCERTVSAELLEEVKRSKGMVGLTVAANYVGESMGDLLKHARALAEHAGPEAVALGSDFNGTITRVEGVPDTSGLPLLLKELRSAGIPADRSAEAFLGFWKRVNAARSRSPGPARRPG
jgi:microsomal dipeptidase-like Zn-dependent dipeptidase